MGKSSGPYLSISDVSSPPGPTKDGFQVPRFFLSKKINILNENCKGECSMKISEIFNFVGNFYSRRNIFLFSELNFFLTYHIDQKFCVLSISDTFRAI